MRLDLEAGDVPAPVTVSIGIATTRDRPEGLETLLARADAALYRAKELGRNSVHSDAAEWEAEPAPAAPKPARAA